MRRALLLALVAVLPLYSSVAGQVLTKETIGAFLSRQHYGKSFTDSPKQASMWTATLPVTFSRVDRANGRWAIGSNVAVGASYVFVTGKATPQADGSYRLDPQFMIGPVANIGVTPGSAGNLDGSLMVGITIGFSSFAILGGYDVLVSRPVVGVGMQLQSLTFTQKLTRLESLR